MLVIDPEMSDAARLLRASNQARKASLCFAERRQLLRLLVSEKIKAEGLCQLLEYRTPRALPGGRWWGASAGSARGPPAGTTPRTER